MHGLTPEQWNDHIVYLTRENPKTSIQGIGGYLTKLTQPFDIEDIKTAFGGYEFSYILKNKNEVVYSGRFKVEAPPRLDPTRERDGNPSAAANNGQSDLVQQFITVLRDELTRTREAMQGQPNAGGQGEAVKMIAEAATRAMDVIKAQIPPAVDPTKTLESLVNTAKTLGVFGQPAAQGGGILETIQVLKTLGLIGQPPPDPMSQLTMFITLFTKLDELRGDRGGGGGRDWKAVAVEKGLEHLPEVLREIRETRVAAGEIAQTRLEAVRTQERVIRNLPPRPAAGSAAAQPAAASALHPSAAGPLPTVPLGEPEQPPSGAFGAADGLDSGNGSPTSLEASPEFDKWLKRRMVLMIVNGDDAEAIVDFLDVAKPRFANDLVAYTSEQVTAALGADPILKDAVAHPRWPQVLARARAYIFEAQGGAAPVPISTPLQN